METTHFFLMALQHRILHRLLVSKNYLPKTEDSLDEDTTVQIVTSNILSLKGYFAYYYGLDGAVVESMLAHPGSIPDPILVEYGVDHEDLDELALYIDNLAAYTEDPTEYEAEPDTPTQSNAEVDLNELLKDD